MILKIEDILLYTSEDVENSIENLEAIAFMDHSNIPFKKLKYNDSSIHNDIFIGLNNQWDELSEMQLPEVNTFPILTYVEVRDDVLARRSPIKYLSGKTDIENIVSIYENEVA